MAKPEYCPCVTCGKAVKQGGRGRIKRYCDAACNPKKAKAETPSPRECIGCGKRFTPQRNDPRAKRCKKGCGRDTRREARTCICAECGVTFHPTCNSGGIYCSNKCNMTVAARVGAAKRRGQSLSRYTGKLCRVEYRKCICCEIEVIGPRPVRAWANKFCSSCKDILGNAISSHNGRIEFLRDKLWGRNCEICGDVFTPHQETSRTCSIVCYKKTEESKALKRAAKARRRAKTKTNGPYELIDPIDVFERDGWRCYLCGDDTPKSLRGKHEPKSPEMDHVRPLTRDGTHTGDNVRCACRACNALKSDSLVTEVNGEWLIIPRYYGMQARWLVAFR